ncbi:MAG: hypothetical protein COA32_13135 [Fluviicola sp.]|nr:MAG: hypothetical protein COA32_13135 [Fluviicola sp.]
MSLIKVKLKRFFTGGDARSKRAKKNVIVSVFTKIISIGISFLIVPITLNYIGKIEYGIWMTISSIIAWFAFFDIGLGNGLRNKLSEELARGNLEKARTYISSSIFILGVISLGLLILFIILSPFIPWNEVFNTQKVSSTVLYRSVGVVFFFFCVGFVVKILSSILQAMQRHAINDIMGLIAQIYSLLFIYILVKTSSSDSGSLFYLCLIYGSNTALIFLIGNFLFFRKSLSHLKPKFKYVNIRESLPLLKLGGWFFINQIMYMIVAKSALIVVIQLFGPEEVTVYNLSLRYMSFISIFFMIALTPYLTAFTEAYVKGEYDWIKKTIKSLFYIWLLGVLASIFLIIAQPYFFSVWTKGQVEVPKTLVIVMALSGLLSMLGSVFTLFLNGIGKIKLQFYFLVFQVIMYFPLIYLFYKLQFGLSSILLPMIFFQAIGIALFFTQYKLIITNKAKDIWAR